MIWRKSADASTETNTFMLRYKRYAGLRLVRQEPWNCLVGFICSIQKNIPAIEHMLLQISTKFGEKRVFDGKTFYLFPTVERLATGKREWPAGMQFRFPS